MNDPFPIVCDLGKEFQRRRDGWQKAKALLLLTHLAALASDTLAETGIDAWNLGASQLADAFGIPPEFQEQTRLEGLRHHREGRAAYPVAIAGIAA